ncbi:hypothetical protein BH11PSE9_BH11PSE9_17370 [soil metagenome]
MAGAVIGAGMRNVQAADDGPRSGDWLVGVDDDALKPIALADVKTGAKQLIVFPYDPAAKRARSDSRLNRILLVKPEAAALDAETQARAAAAGGVLGYSAICTHQACDVNSWRPKEQTLLCFCHFSQFHPGESGNVVAGPAPRALPSIALKVDGDKLVIAGAFSAAPGGGG